MKLKFKKRRYRKKKLPKIIHIESGTLYDWIVDTIEILVDMLILCAIIFGWSLVKK